MHTLSAPPSTVGHRARPPHPLAHLSGPRTLLLLVGLVAAAECGLLVVYGVALWRHFDLGSDDAIANQATWLIAHGTLSPFDTIFTDTFWRDTFGLIWWPLAVARVAFSSGLSLLVEQAAAIAATTFALGRLAVVRSRDLGPGARLVLVTGATALALLNPWAFEAFSFSVHSEPIGALGLVLVLSGALERRRWLLGVGLGLALLSGSALIVTALGLGVGLLCLPSLRRSGAVVTIAAVAFLVADVALGAHRGFSFAAQYGYLVGRHPEHVGVGAVVRAVVAHPGRATHVLARRHASILHLIVDGGVLGLFFPPSLLPVLVDVPINALTIGGNFISRVEGFQNWPEVALLLAGGVEVGRWLFRHSSRAARSAIATLLLAGSTILSITMVRFDLPARNYWLGQPAASVQALRVVRAEVRPDEEVLGSINVLGRFAARRYVFFVNDVPQDVPVCTPDLFVVLETEGPYAVLTPAQFAHVQAVVARLPHARVDLHRAHVWAIQIDHLPAGRSVLALPEGRLVEGAAARRLDRSLCR